MQVVFPLILSIVDGCPCSSQETSFNLPLAIVAFLGAMGAINAVVLSFFKPSMRKHVRVNMYAQPFR